MTVGGGRLREVGDGEGRRVFGGEGVKQVVEKDKKGVRERWWAMERKG